MKNEEYVKANIADTLESVTKAMFDFCTSGDRKFHCIMDCLDGAKRSEDCNSYSCKECVEKWLNAERREDE